MDKISLVERRNRQDALPPTLALERARLRDATPAISPTPGNSPDEFTVQLPPQETDRFAALRAEILEGKKTGLDMTARVLPGASRGGMTLTVQLFTREAANLITAHELAEMTHLNVDTIYRYVRKGLIRGHKIGRAWRFAWHEIMDPITRQETKEV